jgi:CBS domain-containing protein
LDEASVRQVVVVRPKVVGAIGERDVARVVHVPDKLINLVTASG